MSLRGAINSKCRECICDSQDVGTPAQQIACCIRTCCPLHSVRPITATVIPTRILNAWAISPDQLCQRTRHLVRESISCSVEGQIDQTQGIKPAGGRETCPQGVHGEILAKS